MASLDLIIVNLALAYIAREYRGTSLSSLLWVLNGYSVVFAAVLAILARVGPLNALSGHRHGVILIIAFFAAAGIVAAGMLTLRSPATAAKSTPPVQ